jgi:ubiquinone/menaquinone biosynthesis C-methylase UbiE
MLRENGYSRMVEPRGINLDEALLHHDHEFLRRGQESMVHELFIPGRTFVPGLEDSLGDKLIIDIACGTGEFTGALAKRFPNKVVGIDINPSALKLGTERYPDIPNLEFREGDVYSLSKMYENEAGLVTANAALHNFEDLDGALKQVYQALQKNGAFFFMDLNPEQILKRRDLKIIYSARRQMGDDDFVRRVILPIRERGKNGDMLDIALAMSIMAAYTKEEISEPIRRVGFSKCHIDIDSVGEGLVGYAIK